MPRQVNIHYAKTHLSKLLEAVEAGEEVVIARAGRPVARVSAIAGGSRRSAMGMDKGRVFIADDFDAPLPDDVLSGFEG